MKKVGLAKKILSIYIIFVIVLCNLSSVYAGNVGDALVTLGGSVEVDGVLYDFDKTSGTIYGIESGGISTLNIPDKISDIEVKGIAVEAFKSCNGLLNITIPEGVIDIDSGAFYGCTSLMQINVNKNNRNYKSIQGVLFDYNTTKIIACPNKKEGYYKIPQGVTSISTYAFAGCNGLTNIVMPESVTHISEGAFYGCSGLTEMIISEKVTQIGDFAFENCSGLTSITIPSVITSLGNSVFSGCSNLIGVIIPEGVTNVEHYAFDGCTSLVDITIPKSVTSIANNAFKDCSALSNVSCYKNSTADNINLYPDSKIDFVYLMSDEENVDARLNNIVAMHNYKINDSASAIGAIETVIDSVQADKELSFSTEKVKIEVADFIDEAIALSAITNSSDGIIKNNMILALSEKADKTKSEVDRLLKENDIVLMRDLLVNATISTGETIQIDAEVKTLPIDNLHIDMGNAGARITLGKTFIEKNASDQPLILSFVVDNDTEINDELLGEEVAATTGNTGKFITNYKLNVPAILSLPVLSDCDLTYQGVKGPEGYAVSMPNASTRKVQFRATQSGTYTVTNVDKLNFKDVNGLSQAQQDTLRRLYAHGLIEGKSVTSFAPTSTLTRAEFTTLLLKTIGQYDATYKGISGFVDVSNQWHAPIVAKAKNLGIIAGYDSDNTFRPDNKINNEQLYHILGVTYSKVNPRAKVSTGIINSMVAKFNDGTSIAQWARENVAVAVNANIYTESQSGNFNSKNEVTRLNSAIAIGKLFEISPFEGNWK